MAPHECATPGPPGTTKELATAQLGPRGFWDHRRMILKLDIERVRTIDEVRDFMAGSEPVDFHLTDRRGAYDFVTRTLRRLSYAGLSKADKGGVRRFVAKITGLSRAQSTRLIGQYQNTGHIRNRRCGATRPFERRYTAVNIRLLAEVDETLGGLCGPTTRRVMRRQYEVFGDERFERLAGLSNSHLSRMRQSTTYRRRRNPTTKTQATQVNIGERRKPHPQGRPGFLRVDSVHQGDLDGRKGVYEVNLVDEVTQYEFVAAVEGISERFLVPALEALIEAFPFEIKGFHVDNGSEYINYRVARLLRKLIHVNEARVRAASMVTALRCGADAPASPQDTIFEVVAEIVFQRYAQVWKPRTLDVNRTDLRRQILPAFAARQIAEITR